MCAHVSEIQLNPIKPFILDVCAIGTKHLAHKQLTRSKKYPFKVWSMDKQWLPLLTGATVKLFE